MKSDHRQHAAGFSFFGAIGIVLVQVAGGADAGIMDLFNAERTALPDNFDGEVDFVVRRTNARTQLHDHVCGIGTEAISHFQNRVRDDAELGTFASGMHKAHRGGFGVDEINCATVGDVNAEGDAPLIRDKTVARGKFEAHKAAATAIDNGNVVSVDLVSGEQRPIADTDCVANLTMHNVEPL